MCCEMLFDAGVEWKDQCKRNHIIGLGRERERERSELDTIFSWLSIVCACVSFCCFAFVFLCVTPSTPVCVMLLFFNSCSRFSCFWKWELHITKTKTKPKKNVNAFIFDLPCVCAQFPLCFRNDSSSSSSSGGGDMWSICRLNGLFQCY